MSFRHHFKSGNFITHVIPFQVLEQAVNPKGILRHVITRLRRVLLAKPGDYWTGIQLWPDEHKPTGICITLVVTETAVLRDDVH